jgi:hypothetical protein
VQRLQDFTATQSGSAARPSFRAVDHKAEPRRPALDSPSAMRSRYSRISRRARRLIAFETPARIARLTISCNHSRCVSRSACFIRSFEECGNVSGQQSSTCSDSEEAIFGIAVCSDQLERVRRCPLATIIQPKSINHCMHTHHHDYPIIHMPQVPARRLLENQTAIVTGASSGIGKSIAVALGAAGAPMSALTLLLVLRRPRPL